MAYVATAAVAAILFIGSSAAALAEDASTTPSTGAPATLTTSAPSQDDPTAVICRRGEPVTGSHFPGPTQCHTRAEWDRIRQQARDTTMHVQTTGGAGAMPGM